MTALYEELMPVFDVSDEIAVVVAASTEDTWEALVNVDLIAVGKKHPLAGALSMARILPEIVVDLIHGETPDQAPDGMRLRDMAGDESGVGGWVLLGERPGSELALGLVGKFWKPVIEYATVRRDDFAGFSEPGFARTIYAFSLKPIGADQTLLTAVMRTHTTDAKARKWFRRYWTFGVGSGAHVLVSGLLEMVRESAEAGS